MLKKIVYSILLQLVRILSPETIYQFSKRILIDLSKSKGALSHVVIRKRIYKNFMRLYPVNYSFELGRTYGLFSLIREIKEIEGDVVEFGVGNGKSFFTWASAIKYFGIKKTIYGFDSFEGFPSASIQDLGSRVREVGKKVEGWSHIAGPDYITNFIFMDEGIDGSKSLFHDGFPEMKLIKGYFDETICSVPDKISFLHLDADMYESTLIPLKFCISRMSLGGIILFDEYHEFERWPGVRKAVEEVCIPLGLFPEYDYHSSRYIIRIK